jgi:hypothetical protein
MGKKCRGIAVPALGWPGRITLHHKIDVTTNGRGSGRIEATID